MYAKLGADSVEVRTSTMNERKSEDTKRRLKKLPFLLFNIIWVIPLADSVGRRKGAEGEEGYLSIVLKKKSTIVAVFVVRTNIAENDLKKAVVQAVKNPLFLKEEEDQTLEELTESILLEDGVEDEEEELEENLDSLLAEMEKY